MWDSIESVSAAAQVLDYAGGAGFDHGEGVVKPVEAAVPGVGHRSLHPSCIGRNSGCVCRVCWGGRGFCRVHEALVWGARALKTLRFFSFAVSGNI